MVFGCSSSQEPERASPLDPYGKVEKVDGEALVLRAGINNAVHLHMGDPLFGGDVVSTEGGGALELRVRDNSVLSVRSGSRIRINPTLAPELEAPSVLLQRGRVYLRTQLPSGNPRLVLETFHLRVMAQAAELEAGVAEDLGILLCAHKGNIQVEGTGERTVVEAKQETEVEFLERPSPARPFRERSEADWAAWMAARFRNLTTRIPELVARMDRSLKETGAERLEVRAELDTRGREMETLAQSLAGAGQAPQVHGEDSAGRLRELARLQAGSLIRLRHLDNRTESLLLEADRLRKRAQAMKKELGDRNQPVEEMLRLLLEGGKPLGKALQEERSYLMAQSQRWSLAVASAGGFPPELEKKSATEPAKIPPEAKSTGPQSQGRQEAKAKSAPAGAGSKSAAKSTGGQAKSSQKPKAETVQTKSKTQQKASTVKKAPSGGSSSGKQKTPETDKQGARNRTRSQGPPP